MRRRKIVIREATEIAPGLYRLGTEQVSWYLLEAGSRLCAIDAGLPKLADTLDQELAKAGLSTDRIEAVVLTHSDGNHTGVARAKQKRDRHARPPRLLLRIVHCDGAVRRDRGYRVCLYASAMSGDHRALGLRSG